MTPQGFEHGTKMVSIGLLYLCAIDEEDILSCWKYYKPGNNPYSKQYLKTYDNDNDQIKIKSVHCGSVYTCYITLGINNLNCVSMNAYLKSTNDLYNYFPPGIQADPLSYDVGLAVCALNKLREAHCFDDKNT